MVNFIFVRDGKGRNKSQERCPNNLQVGTVNPLKFGSGITYAGYQETNGQ